MPQPIKARTRGDSWCAFYSAAEDTWYRVKEGDPRGTHLLHTAGAASDSRFPLSDFPEAPPLTDAEKRASLEPELRQLEERKAFLEAELKAIKCGALKQVAQMTDSEPFQIAIEIVSVQAQACLPPELSQGELEAIVRKRQIAGNWQPDAAYGQGASVIPTVSNGHLYRCTVAGTSGSTEPAWNQFGGTTTTDGTVTWMEAGLEHGFFDLDQATSDAWLLKAGKASPLVQNSSAGQSMASQQLFEHCERMAAHWLPCKAA